MLGERPRRRTASREIAGMQCGREPVDQRKDHKRLRIEQKMDEPSRGEGVVPQAYREQYGPKADHDDAPNKAEGDEVIGSEEEAARQPDTGIPPANATKPGHQQPAIENLFAQWGGDHEEQDVNCGRMRAMEIDPSFRRASDADDVG